LKLEEGRNEGRREISLPEKKEEPTHSPTRKKKVVEKCYSFGEGKKDQAKGEKEKKRWGGRRGESRYEIGGVAFPGGEKRDTRPCNNPEAREKKNQSEGEKKEKDSRTVSLSKIEKKFWSVKVWERKVTRRIIAGGRGTRKVKKVPGNERGEKKKKSRTCCRKKRLEKRKDRGGKGELPLHTISKKRLSLQAGKDEAGAALAPGGGREG